MLEDEVKTYEFSRYERGMAGSRVSFVTLNCMVKAALMAIESLRGHCCAVLLIGKN